MKYRKVDHVHWEDITEIRMILHISACIPKEGLRYWAKSVGSVENDTAGLKLCVDRGDPFAKRLWAKIIAERLR